MPSKILVVEDEKDVRDLILLHLGRNGFETREAEDGEKALGLLSDNSNFDLVVLDWMLPGVSGLEICEKLQGKLPILLVTARADTSDIVQGLNSGADDYISKPFDIPVFLARVRALLRRSALQSITQENPASHAQDITSQQSLKQTLTIGGLRVDLDAHRAYCNEEEVPLTPSEFKLLSALMSNQGRALSREKLIELVQGMGVVVVERAIDTHVFGLRKKLGNCADFIETIRGVGYRVST